MRFGDEAVAWIALRSATDVGDVTARRLLDRFGTPRAALIATAHDLSAEGFAPDLAAALDAVTESEAYAELERIERAGARVIGLTADDYPALLRQLPDAPIYLIARGEVRFDGPAIAIVGARNATPYGRDVATRLAEDLAHAGVTVVSGMARGIDGAAHLGALRGRGHTIAVLGSGIDVIYPPEHQELSERIVASGALLSERPIGASPRPEHFPARNRIIAGMTRGTVVVEAAERSGSLITARLAMDSGREVYAVPGRVDSPLSAGTHRLIQQGAKLTGRLEDILDEIGPALSGRVSMPVAGTPAAVGRVREELDPLLRLFVAGPLTIDELIRESGRPVSQVLAWVFEQELRGTLNQLPGKQFQLHHGVGG